MILGIYGSGGLGREIYEIAVRRNNVTFLWEEILFIDDVNDEGEFFGTRRINFDTLKEFKGNCECVVAVGEPSSRQKLFQKLDRENIKLTCLVDPTAIISPTAKLGKGVIICEYSSIHVGVELESNILVQPYCAIGHDSKVGNHSVISAYCAQGGRIVLGERVYVGMQATILENLTIGDDAIVGMGSVVYRDVPTGVTVLGNPARVTRGNDSHKVFAS